MIENEAIRRRKAWDEIRPALEKLGCRVWRLHGDDDQWRVEGPDIDFLVDLTGRRVDDLFLELENEPSLFYNSRARC